MEVKPTLKLDKDVICKAKEYASLQHRSLSGIVESYLQLLNNTPTAVNEEGTGISDFVKSMSTPTLEDALQYFGALQSACDVLITRNPKDFLHSSIPVMTADEYIASLFQKGGL